VTNKLTIRIRGKRYLLKVEIITATGNELDLCFEKIQHEKWISR